MAIHSETGDAGFDLWDEWSRQAPSYKASDARAVWRSFKPGRGVTIGTLYHLAREHGWQGQEPVARELSPGEKRRRAEEQRREEARRKRRAEEAALASRKLLDSALYDYHPYLARKGFPAERGLVATGDFRLGQKVVVNAGDLLVPMRHHRSGKLQSLQSITPEGGKKFFPGGAASKAAFNIGRSQVTWYCEGYATGLSVRAALQRLYRRDQVVICFSAHNLPVVAEPGGYVVADHDFWKCGSPACGHRWDAAGADCCPACGSTRLVEPAGEKCAKATGLPYWLPPEPGDANDYHLAHGVGAVADALREVLNA